MKNKVWTLVLIFSFFVCRGNLVAEERYGAKLVVYKLGRQWIKGELIAVRQNSLLSLSSEGADVSVDINDINVIIIEKKSRALIGALGGFLIGGIVGGYCFAREREDETGFETAMRIYFSPLSILTCGALGAVFGAGLGAAFGKDETIKIEGKSDTEIKKVLEKLRRQARITNAQ